MRSLLILTVSVLVLGSFAAFGNDTVVLTGSPFGVAYGEGSSNLDRLMNYIHDLGLARTKVSFYWHKL